MSCLKQINKQSKNEFAKLKRKAWKVWSEYIRRKYADKEGMVLCYTCGVKKHWSEMHAGHFHHDRLDFDERNIHPQCPQCNTFKHGNLAIYGTRLAEELGKAGMKKLLLDANTKIYTEKELKEIIIKYKI
jgi:hypothetical protein